MDDAYKKEFHLSGEIGKFRLIKDYLKNSMEDRDTSLNP